MAKFKQFEPLEYLNLVGYESPDERGRPLSHFYRGEHGSLASIENGDWERLVADLRVEWLSIKYLNVHGCEVSNSTIKSLRFGGCEVDATVGEGIVKLNGLRRLRIDESVAEPSFWKNLPDHPSLTTLILELSPVSGEGWNSLCRIEGLRELVLSFPWDKTKRTSAPRYDLLKPPLQPEGSCPGDADWEHLTGLTNLEQLVIRNAPLPESAMQSIAALPNLRKLELENVSVDASSLAKLGNSTSLELLDLRETNVTADELRTFIENNAHLVVTHNLSELELGNDRRRAQLIGR